MIHLDKHCQAGKTKANWDDFLVLRSRMSVCFGTFHVKVSFLLPFFLVCLIYDAI